MIFERPRAPTERRRSRIPVHNFLGHPTWDGPTSTTPVLAENQRGGKLLLRSAHCLNGRERAIVAPTIFIFIFLLASSAQPQKGNILQRALLVAFSCIYWVGIMYLRITGNTRVINPGGRWGPGTGGRRED